MEKIIIHTYRISFFVKCDNHGYLLDNLKINIKNFLQNYLHQSVELPKENYYDAPNIKNVY